MARTVIPVTKRVFDGAVAEPVGLAVDQVNGMLVTPKEPRQLSLRVTNTSGADKTLTIRAGTGSQDVGSPGADKVVTVPTAAPSSIQLGPFTGAYYDTATGGLNLDFQAAFAGLIWAYEDPRGN